MGSKKRLLILAVLLILSFAISCGVSLILSGGSGSPTQTGQLSATKPSEGSEGMAAYLRTELETIRPKDTQLTELIRDCRVKLAELERKEDRLEQRERRIKMAEGLLKQETEHLESLRVRLVGPLTRLKEAKAELAKGIIDISIVERTNLKKNAKVYDKMDPEGCARIFLSKCKNDKHTDVAKQLFYMSERSHAKVLAALAKTDPESADKVTDELSKVKEQG